MDQLSCLERQSQRPRERTPVDVLSGEQDLYPIHETQAVRARWPLHMGPGVGQTNPNPPLRRADHTMCHTCNSTTVCYDTMILRTEN